MDKAQQRLFADDHREQVGTVAQKVWSCTFLVLLFFKFLYRIRLEIILQMKVIVKKNTALTVSFTGGFFIGIAT